jgi:hypothetical protein
MNNEIGGARSRYGREQRCIQVTGEETSRIEATWNI